MIYRFLGQIKQTELASINFCTDEVAEIFTVPLDYLLHMVHIQYGV
jgi:hypothetical protein